MSSGVSGKDAVVTVSGTTVCGTNWSIDFNCDRLDVTCFTDEGWKSFVGGLKGATGSIEHFDDPTGISPDTLYAVSLSTGSGGVYSGSALIDINQTVGVADTVKATYGLQFSGSITVS